MQPSPTPPERVKVWLARTILVVFIAAMVGALVVATILEPGLLIVWGSGVVVVATWWAIGVLDA